jgi:hypothetical protein
MPKDVTERFKPAWLSEPSAVERLRHCWVAAGEHGRELGD